MKGILERYSDALLAILGKRQQKMQNVPISKYGTPNQWSITDGGLQMEQHG
jgi:hypothetical protein